MPDRTYSLPTCKKCGGTAVPIPPDTVACMGCGLTIRGKGLTDARERWTAEAGAGEATCYRCGHRAGLEYEAGQSCLCGGVYLEDRDREAIRRLQGLAEAAMEHAAGDGGKRSAYQLLVEALEDWCQTMRELGPGAKLDASAAAEHLEDHLLVHGHHMDTRAARVHFYHGQKVSEMTIDEAEDALETSAWRDDIMTLELHQALCKQAGRELASLEQEQEPQPEEAETEHGRPDDVEPGPVPLFESHDPAAALLHRVLSEDLLEDVRQTLCAYWHRLDLEERQQQPVLVDGTRSPGQRVRALLDRLQPAGGADHA